MARLTSRVTLLVLLAGTLLGAFSGVARAAVTPVQQTALLTAHNAIRRDVAAAETQRLGRTVTIPDLVWDPGAAGVAQAWADHLRSSGRADHNPNRGNLGENVYIETGSDVTTVADRAVAVWASERPMYTWDTNSCSAVCGHFTQLIWAGTTSVGCGISTDGVFTYVVCDYGPPGNILGQRPYEPSGGPPLTTVPPAMAGAASPPVAAPAAADLTGNWTVDDFGFGAGGSLSMTQTGNQVIGSYAYDDPSGCGSESGTLEATVTGMTLLFNTAETGCGGDRSGSGTAVIAADGNSFSSGTFWNATRTGP